MRKRGVQMFAAVGLIACGTNSARTAQSVAREQSGQVMDVKFDDSECVVTVETVTERETDKGWTVVSRVPAAGVPVEITFQGREFKKGDDLAPDDTGLARGVTDPSGRARFEYSKVQLPDRLCGVQVLHARVVMTSSPDRDSNWRISNSKAFCPAFHAHQDAADVQNKAEFDALTIDDARSVWRNPPPRAPGEAWAHAELLRKKFCDDVRPQSADGELCFLVGENTARRGSASEAGEYFEMACKLGVRAACERDEYKARIAGRRLRADEIISGAREAVTQNLKAPSQASWGAASIVDRSGSCNLVKLTVDAPNSFGAMLRSWWLVTITRQGEKLGVVTSGAGPSSFDHEPSAGEVNIYKSMTSWTSCR